jgi:small Trp-rich protein
LAAPVDPIVGNMQVFQGAVMPLIIIIALLVGLRYFEVWRFAAISWWYIVGLMVFAFIWFEFIEKMLGLDKKKEHNVDEQRRKDRIKQTFDKKK